MICPICTFPLIEKNSPKNAINFYQSEKISDEFLQS